MSFNKSAVKRMSTVVGVRRISHEVTDLVNDLVIDYTNELLTRLEILLEFTGRKTITSNDIYFLGQLGLFPKLLIPDNLDKTTTGFGKKSGLGKPFQLYTLRQSFNNLVRDKLSSGYRLGKNVVTMLQFLVEWRVIKTLQLASSYTAIGHRDTLLPEDFRAAASMLPKNK